MKEHRFGRRNRKRAVWQRSLVAAFVLALFVLASGLKSAAQTSLPPLDPPSQSQNAQDSQAQDTPNQDQTADDQPTTEPNVPATAVPSPPAFSANPPAPRAKAASGSQASLVDRSSPAEASGVPVASAVPEATVAFVAMPEPTGPQDPKQKAIYDSSANLLKLANVLKAEVDKTTADQLSVSVVRKAGEIEQLAHKMRIQ